MNKKDFDRLLKLRIIDDDFGFIILNDKHTLESLLRIILNKPKLNILSYERQKRLNNFNQRSIVLDYYIECDDIIINMELENRKDRAKGLRFRFHSSSLDIYTSTVNMKFNDLKKSIIIIFGDFDYLGKGKPLYCFKRYENECHEVYDDESEIIYVNATYKGDDEIGRLISDFVQSDPTKIYNDFLRDRVNELKNTKEGVNAMCEIFDEIRKEGKELGILEGIEKGKQEGVEETTISNIKSLMLYLNGDIHKTMKILNINEKDYEKYKDLVLA